MSDEDKERATQNRDWILTEKEPCFGAADIGRAGKDLLVYNSAVTNRAGVDWLRRHFPDLRIRTVWFHEPFPYHIDATFILVRPGLALNSPVRPPLAPGMIEFFKKNDREVLDGAEPATEGYSPLSFCSKWLCMNTLTLDPKNVVVDAVAIYQMEMFDKLGLEVIPIPFGAVNAFGGGLHCCTADVHRKGNCQDYFPKQVEGF